jgi:mRNA interferase RelE/StbE
MAFYRVELKPAARKDFRKIPKKTLLRVLEGIEGLAQDPFRPPSIKLVDADRLYRLRVGDYRIIYEVEAEIGAIIIHHVRHRREVYRSL